MRYIRRNMARAWLDRQWPEKDLKVWNFARKPKGRARDGRRIHPWNTANTPVSPLLVQSAVLRDAIYIYVYSLVCVCVCLR